MVLERLEYIYSTRPKKSLGQHYLKDKRILEKIVKSLNLTGNEIILEIGSGHGELTCYLAQQSKELYAVEIDPSNIEFLRRRFESFHNIHLIQDDILRFQSEVFFDLIVGNIPYYISGILLGTLSERWSYKKAVFTLQKEVGRRLSATPGSKEYGVLTLAVCYNHKVRVLFDVPRECFYPEPKVDSVVVELERIEDKSISKPFYMKVVKAAFSSRRKMLPNVLVGLGLDREYVINLLKDFGIDPKRRGETLSVEDFVLLSERIYEAIITSKT